MLTLLAGLAFAATLGSADHGTNSVLPPPACLAVAQAIVNDLQSDADKLAGKHITLKVEAGRPFLWTTLLHDSDLIAAEIDYNHTIVVHNLFCLLQLQHQAAVITHEIGHVIDYSVDTTPLVFRLPQTIFMSWHDRPTEVAANNYAKQLIVLKGGDPHIIDIFEGGGAPVVVVVPDVQ